MIIAAIRGHNSDLTVPTIQKILPTLASPEIKSGWVPSYRKLLYFLAKQRRHVRCSPRPSNGKRAKSSSRFGKQKFRDSPFECIPIPLVSTHPLGART